MVTHGNKAGRRVPADGISRIRHRPKIDDVAGTSRPALLQRHRHLFQNMS